MAALFSLYQIMTKDKANTTGPMTNPMIDAPGSFEACLTARRDVLSH